MPTAIRTDDPKGAIGATKCPLHLLPPKPMQDIAWVLRGGADKYGEFNWLYNNVCASTYVGAIKRHLDSWWSGELLDPESGISHLAHVAASAMIVLDAQKHGTLNLNIPYGVPVDGSPSPKDASVFQDFEGMKDRFEDAFGLTETPADPLRIPDHMFPLPELPEGYTGWVSRGYGWKGVNVRYASCKDGEWYSFADDDDNTLACTNYFYIEAVKHNQCGCGYRLVRKHTGELFCENCGK